jgi:hypothetical protein
VIDVVTNFRGIIFDLCGRMEWPVYRWLPGNAEELPCYVVGRPNVAEGAQRFMCEVVIPVYALGRTLRDDDAQSELDLAADSLLNLLWTIKSESGVNLRSTRLEASVLTIGSTDVPAYSLSVEGATTFC